MRQTEAVEKEFGSGFGTSIEGESRRMRSGKVGWSRSRERGVRGSIDERKIEQRRIHVADRQLRSALSKRMRGHLRRVQHLVLVRQAFCSILRDLTQQHLLSLQLRHRAFVHLLYRRPNVRKLCLFGILCLHPLFRLKLSLDGSVLLPRISQLAPVF